MGNIDGTLCERDIVNVFSKYNIESARIITDRDGALLPCPDLSPFCPPDIGRHGLLVLNKLVPSREFSGQL